jgi:hypothetical protein
MTNSSPNDNSEFRELKTATWPLLFTYKSRVFGTGYIAEIELCGRLLAELEMEGVWLYGVNPGALAVGAATLSTANVDLHKALAGVFADFAGQASTFAEFQLQVETFFNTTDADSLMEWEHCVARLKASTTIERPAGLPVMDSIKTKVFVRVAEQSTDTITPEDNKLADYEPVSSHLAAAA